MENSPSADTVLVLDTPFARKFCVSFRGEVLVASRWLEAGERKRSSPAAALPAIADEVRRQLAAYGRRKLALFSLPLHISGSAFECRIRKLVATIPFGTVASYGEVARAAGHPGAHRAVARAMGGLDFALLVPAHRVIGADGRIKGANAQSMRVRLFEFEAG